APFLCLIEDHLLWPDKRFLPHQVEETFVDARVVGQLGVERGDQEAPLAKQDRLAVELGEDLHLGAHLDNARRADEDAAQRLVLLLESEIGFEARDLPAVSISLDGEVDEAEVVAVEEDHAGASPEDRGAEAPDGLL